MWLLPELTAAAIIGISTVIIAILVKIVGLPDQIRKNYRKKSTRGLSTVFILLTTLSYTLWTIHGFMQQDPVLIIGQGLGVFTSGIIVFQIFRYRKNN